MLQNTLLLPVLTFPITTRLSWNCFTASYIPPWPNQLRSFCCNPGSYSWGCLLESTDLASIVGTCRYGCMWLQATIQLNLTTRSSEFRTDHDQHTNFSPCAYPSLSHLAETNNTWVIYPIPTKIRPCLFRYARSAIDTAAAACTPTWPTPEYGCATARGLCRFIKCSFHQF